MNNIRDTEVNAASTCGRGGRIEGRNVPYHNTTNFRQVYKNEVVIYRCIFDTHLNTV